MRRTAGLGGGNKPYIMHISSFGGVSYSFNVAYGAGKAGVDKLAKDMSVELAKEGTNVGCLALYPGIVRTERMEDILSSGQWKNKTGLAVVDACIESPVLTGRVIAALYREAQTSIGLKRRYGVSTSPLYMTILCNVYAPNDSGTVQVVAEAAKELVSDVNGNIPPSI